MNQAPDLKTLTDYLIYELAKAVALPKSSLVQALIRKMFGPAAKKFAQLALDLDHVIGKSGLAAAARWVLPRFAKSHDAQGAEFIPPDGPLVIASNHPGSIDSVAITANVERSDYKIIIGNIPFFQNLPNLRQRALFAPPVENVSGRMRLVREAIRHLGTGGALLIFARGTIEADLSILPRSKPEFHLWSRSLEIFLRHVPETRILTSIVSGVIARSNFYHPITWLRKNRADKQRLAFMYQFIRQMVSGREIFGVTPCVTFGEIVAGESRDHILAEVEAAASRTLQKHLAWVL
jgi:hypothetical protein